jgi:hypothetical protein
MAILFNQIAGDFRSRLMMKAGKYISNRAYQLGK